MTILEFFDPCNLDHLKAYRHLERTGCWPAGFVPEDITFPNCWQISLVGIMASKWLSACESGCINWGKWVRVVEDKTSE